MTFSLLAELMPDSCHVSSVVSFAEGFGDGRVLGVLEESPGGHHVTRTRSNCAGKPAGNVWVNVSYLDLGVFRHVDLEVVCDDEGGGEGGDGGGGQLLKGLGDLGQGGPVGLAQIVQGHHAVVCRQPVQKLVDVEAKGLDVSPDLSELGEDVHVSPFSFLSHFRGRNVMLEDGSHSQKIPNFFPLGRRAAKWVY